MHAHQSFTHQQQIRFRDKLFKQNRSHRLRREATGSPNLKTELTILLCGNEADVMHAG